ncbi:MAG TPA: hemerythrin domain-containing protein [Bacteroidales bacterium]|nr:hemerythrin domain-containing protein [Bacteroidales bacterium]
MKIFDELVKDHKTQRTLADQLLETHGESPERKKLYKELKKELKIHEQSEERYFYIPLMEVDKSQEQARHSVAEHHEIDELVEKIDETEMSSSAWLAHFKELHELVNHHLDEEEEEVFPLAKKVLNDKEIESLGREYRKMMEEKK